MRVSLWSLPHPANMALAGHAAKHRLSAATRDSICLSIGWGCQTEQLKDFLVSSACSLKTFEYWRCSQKSLLPTEPRYHSGLVSHEMWKTFGHPDLRISWRIHSSASGSVDLWTTCLADSLALGKLWATSLLWFAEQRIGTLFESARIPLPPTFLFFTSGRNSGLNSLASSLTHESLGLRKGLNRRWWAFIWKPRSHWASEVFIGCAFCNKLCRAGKTLAQASGLCSSRPAARICLVIALMFLSLLARVFSRSCARSALAFSSK